MFSSLPKIADKQFVIGFLLPLLVFIIGLEVALRPCAEVEALAQAFWAEKDIGKLAILVAVLWVAAIGLLLTNRVLHRFLSGYAWPLKSWWGRDRLLERWDRLAKTINSEAARLADPATLRDKRYESDQRAHNARVYRFRRTFPRERGDVLGTRLGNAMRVSERYPNRIYGAEGVILWPRLMGVASKEVQGQLGDARSQVDCFVNLALLGLCLAATTLETLLRQVIAANGHLSCPAMAPLGVWTAGSLVSAWLFYELAIERAEALGEVTRAAFDLYLPKLAAELGYEFPQDLAGQRALWADLQQSYLYFTPAIRPWRHQPPASKTVAEPEPSAPEGS